MEIIRKVELETLQIAKSSYETLFVCIWFLIIDILLGASK